MALSTYLDFAENDYRYFMFAYDHGVIANAMAAEAQGICEKYFKHIINEYYEPRTENEKNSCAAVLRTHNLKRLIRFLEDDLGITITAEEKARILPVNGYYFTARYPGDESIEVDRDDIDQCGKAVKTCRDITHQVIAELELSSREDDRKSPDEERD